MVKVMPKATIQDLQKEKATEEKTPEDSRK